MWRLFTVYVLYGYSLDVYLNLSLIVYFIVIASLARINLEMIHKTQRENFGMVGDQLYRSGQPNELNFPFLEKLGLRTVIFLSDEPPNPRFARFVDDMGVVLHHIVNDVRNSPWGTISEEGILRALEIILDESKYPIIITCLLGRHRTGCLRKLQRWNLASIFEEYRRYAGPKARAANEQFIELFDTDLVRLYRSQSRVLIESSGEISEERSEDRKEPTKPLDSLLEGK